MYFTKVNAALVRTHADGGQCAIVVADGKLQLPVKDELDFLNFMLGQVLHPKSDGLLPFAAPDTQRKLDSAIFMHLEGIIDPLGREVLLCPIGVLIHETFSLGLKGCVPGKEILMANGLNGLAVHRVLTFEGRLQVGFSNPLAVIRKRILLGNFKAIIPNLPRYAVTLEQLMDIFF